MTYIGASRTAYHYAHKHTDPRPSRFKDADAYRSWAARADKWAAERA